MTNFKLKVNDASRERTAHRRALVIAGVVGSFLLAASAGAFADAATLATGSVQDVYRGESGEDAYRLEIPAAGILILDVADLARGSAEPTIDFAYAGTAASAAIELECFPNRRMLRLLRAGSFIFRVRTDFTSETELYRLQVGFSEGREVEEYESDPIAGKSHDGGRCDGSLMLREVEEYESDPIAGKATGPPVRVSPICGLAEADDHGDSWACATRIRLGDPVSGEIRKASATDLDHFAFTLGRRSTVVLETRGDSDTFGQLFDRHGRRLAADDDRGEGDNFRIVHGLAPGLYVLRVEGTFGAQGAYTVLSEAGLRR